MLRFRQWWCRRFGHRPVLVDGVSLTRCSRCGVPPWPGDRVWWWWKAGQRRNRVFIREDAEGGDE